MTTPALTHAGGVVFRRRGGQIEFLLTTSRRTPGEWVLPKGHIEPDETVEQAAVREVLEETGVSVTLGPALGDVDVAKAKRVDRIRFFLMKATGEAPAFEGRDVVWLTAPDAITRIAFPESQALLGRAADLAAQDDSSSAPPTSSSAIGVTQAKE